MEKFYVTTAISYPNSVPHIGHALEYVQADFFARYYRLAGKDVYFLTGSDVHGLKIQRNAEKAGLPVKAFLDTQIPTWIELDRVSAISYDRFIRTDDADHEAMSQALWNACAASGDIYKKRYQAWYNVKEEEFLGLVEEHPDPSAFGVDLQFIEKIDEENYFFALSRYSDDVIRILETGEYKVVPMGRRQELLNFIKEKGLQDVSISREKSKLEWGVPVPGDDTQVMYVWYDALTNYLTPSCDIVDGKIVPGPLWPADLHCIGKDISRFHALLWTGMLLSAGLPLPKELLTHGHITSGGQKMSKSLGNVIEPLALFAEYGTDPVRWFLLKEMDTLGDADFTIPRMRDVYTADLANDYGNLVSRVWTMCQKYRDGKVPAVDVSSLGNVEQMVVADAWSKYEDAVERRQINEALSVAHGLLVFCNKRIEEYKPWVLAKDEHQADKLSELLYELLEIIRHVTVMASPVLVVTAPKVASGVFPNVPEASWKSFEVAKQWGGLVAGTELGTEQVILFPRLEAPVA